MGKIYIGTNTKMYMTIERTAQYLTELAELLNDIDRSLLELFVIPSFTALESVKEIALKNGIILGAQNMCWEDEGQFTGEISPIMLKEVGVSIVEIGHSERRSIFYETDEMENRKILRALHHGFTTLLCIGETLEQKHCKMAKAILRTQLCKGLKNVPETMAPMLRIAYEPIWSIGNTGEPAQTSYVSEMSAVIRDELSIQFGTTLAKQIPIIYGGSVNIENAASLLTLPEINGLFIGRSAWDAKNFSKIIHKVLSYRPVVHKNL